MCVQPQITGETVGEVKPVADMHQRKAEMARNSDCFIALPGPIHFSLLCINRSRELVSFLVLVVINDVFCVYNFFFILYFGCRWLWHSGGVIRSDYLGSVRHP